MRIIFALIFTFAAVAARAEGEATDKYVGYYYPAITSEEVFSRVLRGSPKANTAVRVNFVTAVTKAQLAAPETPRFAMFEKGDASDKLIIVGLDDDVFSTLFRARAVLAQLTSNLRGTEFFINQNLHLEGTLYDMLQIMNFSELVITDGETWAHKVRFEPQE